MKLIKTAAIGLAILASPAIAQQGGGNGFDPAAIRTMMEQYQRNQLGVTDDEWSVLAPKIAKVNQARMLSNVGGMGGPNGGGGNGGAGGGFDREAFLAAMTGLDADTLAKNPFIAARKELNAVLANKDSTAAQIQEKLKTFREARDKAREELKKAQDDLKSVLTARQEALLVNSGTLD